MSVKCQRCQQFTSFHERHSEIWNFVKQTIHSSFHNTNVSQIADCKIEQFFQNFELPSRRRWTLLASEGFRGRRSDWKRGIGWPFDFFFPSYSLFSFRRKVSSFLQFYGLTELSEMCNAALAPLQVKFRISSKKRSNLKKRKIDLFIEIPIIMTAPGIGIQIYFFCYHSIIFQLGRRYSNLAPRSDSPLLAFVRTLYGWRFTHTAFHIR